MLEALPFDVQLHTRLLLRHQARVEVDAEAGNARLQGIERYDSVVSFKNTGRVRTLDHLLPQVVLTSVAGSISVWCLRIKGCVATRHAAVAITAYGFLLPYLYCATCVPNCRNK